MTPPESPRPHPLPLTGARTVPDVADENYWFQRHVVAYRHVAERVGGTVLDAGCGEGYGLAILQAAGTRGVIGVEVDPLVAAHARARYGPDDVDDVDVVECDLEDLPLVDDTLDAAVCLQVVEHLDEPAVALEELARVVRPGGRVAVTTPNRSTFTPDGAPRNPFHVREYDAGELADLVGAAGLEVTELLGVHHGPVLARRLTDHVGDDPVATLADPGAWNERTRALVRAVRPGDFVVVGDDQQPLAASLDLVAWATVPA